jgi:cytochrome b
VSRQVPLEDEALTGGAPQPVWDLPTRLFHWTLAALIAFSWWSVEYQHSDWHIWSGCAILALLIFRILWGFAGSSTARFVGFVRGPRAIADYWRGGWRGIGHNPLGALSVLALLLVTAVQVGLGLVSQDEDGIVMGPPAQLVSSDTSDEARDIHELWFYVLLGFIALHLLAIVYYRVRGKKLTLPMITGRAASKPEPRRCGRANGGRRWSAWGSQSVSPAGSSPARRRSSFPPCKGGGGGGCF